VKVADFNQDGKLDLAVANDASETVFVLLGRGDGTFYPPVAYTTDVKSSPTGVPPFWGVHSLIVADFDMDKKLDLAVTNFSNADVGVLFGRGDGTFGPPRTYSTGEGPFTLAVGDFNRDGYEDLATGNNSNTLSVLLGSVNGTFQSSHEYPGGQSPASVATGDFNGDGRLDFVVANRDTNIVSVLLNIPYKTSITLISSPSPSTLGFEVTFTATVTGEPFTPDGIVEFAIDNVPTKTVKLNQGKASFSTAALDRGFHTVTATYKGTPQFGESGASVTQKVQ
jgi:FG-GAP-like repeat/Bacterial Ig-like domain (group 3)